MSAYYNEHDKFAAAWLRELIADGLIAEGEVDERSIEDVRPSELAGFVQCHFFAGIGIWSLALRQAGWPDDKPIWTGSCPCQPFSAAGKGGGFADERHLWPAFHWLIEQCRPELVLGEQVASKDGLAWLDLVSADVEAAGYAFGAADTCAAGFGAPHIRQRLYWLANSTNNNRGRRERSEEAGAGTNGERRRRSASGGSAGVLVNAASGGCRVGGDEALARGSGHADGSSGLSGRLADSGSSRLEGLSGHGDDRDKPGWIGEEAARPTSASGGTGERAGPTNGIWRAADWLSCTDGKWRPVESGTFPLVASGAVRNRMGALRGAGNAINLAQAQGFIEAVMSALST